MKNQLCLFIWCLLSISLKAEGKLPNIIIILADDLGYGDVQCMNPERGKIPTPHMDRVAKEGMMFTDAHCTSSVCTPTRYSLLTGRYNWRTRLQTFVLNGFDRPLIDPDRLTLASFLKQNGYNTAMIGKWHLGLGLPTTDGKKAASISRDELKALMKEKKSYPPAKLSNIDWDGKIQGGPVDLGFDSWSGISASLDFPPYVWIKDRNFVAKGVQAKAFWRPGPASEDFEAIDVLDRFANESVEYIQNYKDENPFFAYIPLTSPHTPIVPTKKWKGKSGLGSYGDFVMQTDDVVGQIVQAIEKKGISENTLIIVTSDNGTSKQAKFKHLEKHGHFASAHLRGSKGDLWEGGHRIPLLVKWPAVIKAGSTSDQLVCQVDFLATFAELVGKPLPDHAGEDSESILPIFKGEKPNFSRNGIISHSISGHFSYRAGGYKLLLASGSGGLTSPNEAEAEDAGLPKAQLYDLAKDPGEQKNLYTDKPEIANKLLAFLEADIKNGRSTRGAKQKNDIPSEKIKLWKGRGKK